MTTNKLLVSSISHSFFDLGLETRILNKIRFSVREGETICILGPNACGKTTLLRIIAGLITPTGGKIIHNGQVVTKPHWSRTMVFQNYNLYPWKNVQENIIFGLKARGFKKQDSERITAQHLELFKIKQYAKHHPNQLSGGTRQKVAITCAIALDPDVLLLDEPFSNLDLFARELLLEKIKKIVEQRNQTTLAVTHSLEEALLLANKIVILSNPPAHVKAIIPIPQKQKNEPDFRHSSAFIEYKKQAWKVLKEEFNE